MTMKYARMDWGTMEAIVNKLGGEEGVYRFLRGEIAISEPHRFWRELDGIVYFSVTSDGATGEEWITRLQKQSCFVSEQTKQLFRSQDFRRGTSYEITAEIAVLKGMLFDNKKRTSKVVRANAHFRNLITPKAEIACLIREKFTDEEVKAMGLKSIVVMHKPIQTFNGDPFLLTIPPSVTGHTLSLSYGNLRERFTSKIGFAFTISRVKTKP